MENSEGIETAVFLGAVSVKESSFYSSVGSLLGVAEATTFGVLFVKGSLWFDVARFLKVTAVVLLIFVAQLIVNSIHEFFEMGVLPPQAVVMDIIGPVVRNNLLFVLAILSIPAFTFMISNARRQTDRAERTQSPKHWQFAAGLPTLSIVFLLGFDNVFSAKSGTAIEAAHPVSPSDGFVHIPLSEADDGALHRYPFKQDSMDIRFLVVRTGLSAYATAFDACQQCYNYGKFCICGGNVICSQCEAAYPVSRLSRLSEHESTRRESPTGASTSDDTGCLPMYLRSRVENGMILISVEDLQSNREYSELRNEEQWGNRFLISETTSRHTRARTANN